jgi:hypothetical protein
MLNTDGRYAGIQEFRDAFEFDHLPDGLPRSVSETFHDHAAALLELLPDGASLTRSLHDLWRSKNEAVLFAVRLAAAQPPGERPFVYPPVRRPGPIGQLGQPHQDRHPDHQPGRADGPAMAQEPVEVTTYGDLARGERRFIDGQPARLRRWQGSPEQSAQIKAGKGPDPIDTADLVRRDGGWWLTGPTPDTLQD